MTDSLLARLEEWASDIQAEYPEMVPSSAAAQWVADLRSAIKRLGLLEEARLALEPFGQVWILMGGDGLTHSICDDNGCVVVDDPDFRVASSVSARIREAGSG